MEKTFVRFTNCSNTFLCRFNCRKMIRPSNSKLLPYSRLTAGEVAPRLLMIASVICVVEEPHNILPIETTRTYGGLYHVLHGSISPLRGVGPEQLKIKGLLERLLRLRILVLAGAVVTTTPVVVGYLFGRGILRLEPVLLLGAITGSIVVEEAGGRVSDLDGKALDFTHGRTLAANRGVLGTNGHLHDALVAGLKKIGA